MAKSATARKSAIKPAMKSAISTQQSAIEKRSTLDLDRVIHERLRLGIISALAVNARLTFNDLKRLLQTTDGNLSVHARKLEDAQYIACDKMFEGRVPRTEYRLTAAGRTSFSAQKSEWAAFARAVEAIIEAMGLEQVPGR